MEIAAARFEVLREDYVDELQTALLEQGSPKIEWAREGNVVTVTAATPRIMLRSRV